MADNKLLAKRGPDEEFLAENDPLAELTRLVGFDSAPPVNMAQHAQRREPAFDLEDELLKELEIYQQPAPANDVARAGHSLVEPREPDFAPDLQADVRNEAEPSHNSELAPERGVQAEPVRNPVVLEAVETFADASGERIYERPASHPVFDLEDEILREFSAFDARRVDHAHEHAVNAEVIHQDPPAPEVMAAAGALPVELLDVPDVRSTMPSGHGRDVYESFRADDLDEAISNALAQEPSSASIEPAFAEADTIQDAAFAPEDVNVPALEPLAANFWSHPGVERPAADEPAVEHIASHAAEASGAAAAADDAYLEQEDELVSQDFADALSVDPAPVAAPRVHAATATSPFVRVIRRPDPEGSADLPAPQVEPAEHIEAAADQMAAQKLAVDHRLAAAEQYPAVDNAARWGVHSKPVAAEDVVRAAPPVVHDFVARQPVAQPPVAALRQPDPVQAAPVYTASADASADFGIDDANFDIDLGDIELDLSDINEPAVSASPDLLAELADTPVAPREAPTIARQEPAPVQQSRAVDTDYASLPFDPSQITQEEERFEPIAEMDVPDIPVVHEDEKPVPHPEYDIDLDAEMAQLFVTATAQPAMSQRGGIADASIAADGATPPNQGRGLDLDDFERALEEDFRRSFAENRAGSAPDRVAIAPVYQETKQVGRGRNWFVLASAAAIVLFGGAGVYAFMSGDTKILASSEPKVILADTEPVKVVPDEPGGKQVPNQNKAVYDRVAGETMDRARQESLLSSNEEPVDVVQRTLLPETIQMDDGTMAATPTGDTVDPRLLPDAEEQDRVTTTNRVVSGVSPRKVKTMVVRPDGSLVEREVTEEDVKQQAANDAELLKIAQKAAQDAAMVSDSAGDDIAKAIENVPERLAPAAETSTASEMAGRLATPDAEGTAVAAKVQPVEPVRLDDAEAVAETPAVPDLKPATDVTARAPADTPLERSIPVEQAAALEAEAADAPVRKVTTTAVKPVPVVRPVEEPADTAAAEAMPEARTEDATTEVSALEEAAPKPVETAVVPAGSYVIQIASLPSEAEAQTSYNRLSAKFAGIIGGKGVDIRRAEIKNKGTYYRVRIPAGTRQEAQALCSEYKSAGGSCLVSK